MSKLSTPSQLARVLRDAKVIAVLGAHPRHEKAAHYVPRYLADRGYRIIPVNMRYAGQTLFDETILSSLTEIDEPVDIVNIFRRSEAVSEHLDEILSMTPQPRVIWMQQGVYNDEVASAVIDAGMEVIQGECTMARHRTLL